MMNSYSKRNFCKFHELAVGAVFICNGNRCTKRSSRTALIAEYGRVFYYAQNEWVEVAE